MCQLTSRQGRWVEEAEDSVIKVQTLEKKKKSTRFYFYKDKMFFFSVQHLFFGRTYCTLSGVHV